jgi:hypothetical protein
VLQGELVRGDVYRQDDLMRIARDPAHRGKTFSTAIGETYARRRTSSERKRWMTTAEAADHLSIATTYLTATVRRTDLQIERVRCGRTWLWRRAAIERLETLRDVCRIGTLTTMRMLAAINTAGFDLTRLPPVSRETRGGVSACTDSDAPAVS